MSKRQIVLDTETTGLDINDGHRIIEIGCIEIIDLFVTGKSFHVYIHPEAKTISKEATKVHGITLEKLEGKPIFKEIADQFCDFIKDDFIIAHNASFDVRFLNYELKRARHRKIIHTEKVIDTLQLARKMFPGSPASLDALCKRFKISLAQRTLHGALLDAQLLARVFLELNSGAQSHLFFDNRSDYNENYENKRREEALRELDLHSRTFFNSEEELTAHQKFINKLINPIWHKIEQPN